MLSNYDQEPFRGIPYLEGNQDDKWIRFYNHTSSAMTNGAVYTFSTRVDYTDSTAPILQPILVACSSIATPGIQVCVVDDPAGSVAAYAWGLAKIRGCVKAMCYGDTNIVVGDQLEVLNASPTTFTQIISATAGVGVILGVSTCAIALESYDTATAALKWVYLLGVRATCT
jgi:hypothetical protein